MNDYKRANRDTRETRKTTVTRDFCSNADGSVLFEMGNTRVICAASFSTDVPDHAIRKGLGWVTADYTMLPYATRPRQARRMLRPDGRSVEIRRLIGRSFRTIIDLSAIQDYSISIDCDVLQADGGTRTAAITGGFIALKLCVEKMLRENLIGKNPIIDNVAAISTGYVEGQLLLDLDYGEDSRADVDMNIVMDGNYNLIEIQGTGEKATFTLKQLDDMIQVSRTAIEELIKIQNIIT